MIPKLTICVATKTVLSAWGNFPPTGLYEGTFGDIGSYHGCLNVPDNAAINHTHYCSLSYKPILPTRLDYELIIRREPKELLNLFDHRDAFHALLRNAQYNHYIYYKLGTCFPIGCSPVDVQKLARLLGKQSILMTGPVKCYSKHADDYENIAQETDGGGDDDDDERKTLAVSTKDLNNGIYIWKPNWTRAQLTALLALGLVTGLIVLLTMVDIALNRLPKICNSINICSARKRQPRKPQASIGRGKFLNESDDAEQQQHLSAKLAAIDRHDNDPNNNNNNNSSNQFHELNRDEAQREFEASNNRDDLIMMMKVLPFEDENNNNTRLLAVDDNNFEDLKNRDTNESFRIGDESDKATAHNMIGLSATTEKKKRSLFMDIVDDCSVVTNFQQFFHISQQQLSNDILCINGIRCITMSWIIVAHTMQYNDWSAFARTLEIETHLKSLINQPLFNATYLVDTFFLMSGLLTSYSSFKVNKDTRQLVGKFSIKVYLVSRYLRLTPQIHFVSLLFILLPKLTSLGSPHWYTMTGEYSENCSNNWWINLLHIQAFYKSSEMCNFVSWWISVDMFYHLLALILILVAYRYGLKFKQNSKTRDREARMQANNGNSWSTMFTCCSLTVIVFSAIQVFKHYSMNLPPNLLSTIPQTGLMWSRMTLEFFFMPYAHAFPFFFGFYLGYLMALHKDQPTPASIGRFKITPKRTFAGWCLVIGLLTLVSYSTYFWVIGKLRYTRLISTAFYFACPIIWSLSLSYIILACQYKRGSFVNELLSCKLFLVLSKASYLVYLSHFLILFTFFGSQNLLLEPTIIMMLYIIAGNIVLSMVFGSLLCIVFEMPWLKTQKRLVSYLR